MGEKHLTLYFIKRLQATRKLRLPSEKREDKDAREIFTVLVQYAIRDYASIISHTQSGPNLFKTIFNMKSTEWLNIVGTEPPTLSTEAGNVYSDCVLCKKAEGRHFGPSRFCYACVFPKSDTFGEGRLEESVDDNSALRRQHHQRFATLSTLAGSLRSQVGSL